MKQCQSLVDIRKRKTLGLSAAQGLKSRDRLNESLELIATNRWVCLGGRGCLDGNTNVVCGACLTGCGTGGQLIFVGGQVVKEFDVAIHEGNMSTFTLPW